MTPQIEIKVVNGVEGLSLYMNGYRIAGTKPWGGGTSVVNWKIGIRQARSAVLLLNKVIAKAEQSNG